MTVEMQKTRFEAVEICGVQGAFRRGARAPVCIAEWHLRLRYADLPGGLVAAMFTGLPYHGGALRDRADRPAYRPAGKRIPGPGTGRLQLAVL